MPKPIDITELRDLLLLSLEHTAALYTAETERMIEMNALRDALERTLPPQWRAHYEAYLKGDAANSFRDRRSFGILKVLEALQLLKP